MHSDTPQPRTVIVQQEHNPRTIIQEPPHLPPTIIMKFLPFILLTTTITTTNAWLFSSCSGGAINNRDKNDCHNISTPSVKYRSDNKCTMFLYAQKSCKGTALVTQEQGKCFGANGGARVQSVKCREGLEA